jgi:hypothetical protein
MFDAVDCFPAAGLKFAPPGRGRRRDDAHPLRHRAPALTCLAILLISVVGFAALAAPWLAPFSPDAQPVDGLSLEGAPLAARAEILARHRHAWA